MENEEWIKENVDTFKINDSLVIKCGHDSYDPEIVTLRGHDPNVVFMCCWNCYNAIIGYVINEIRRFSLKMK
jgi:hypothetical protein